MRIEDREEVTVDLAKVRPLNGQVLLRRKPNDEYSRGGIVIEFTGEKSLWCQVVRVGPLRKHHETRCRIPNCDVKRGDWVTCRPFEGEQYPTFLAPDGWVYGIMDARTLELKLNRERLHGTERT